MTRGAEPETVEERIGYCFRDRSLLLRALTHRSHSHEHSASGRPAVPDNEQLEFLGDAVLGFLVSEMLVGRHPTLSEGRLSKLKAHLVSAAHLHEAAVCMGLGSYLRLGRGEEMSGGRTKRTLLADALEALIAAVYLDGGLEAAREFVLRHVAGELAAGAGAAALPLTDFKSALQEAARARGLPNPRYTVIGESGPSHARTFTVEARVTGSLSSQAESYSKKSASQQAARLLLERLPEPDS